MPPKNKGKGKGKEKGEGRAGEDSGYQHERLQSQNNNRKLLWVQMKTKDMVHLKQIGKKIPLAGKLMLDRKNFQRKK